MSKKDVILIMVDQLSAKWLEVNDGICQTPNLDRLASMGTTFTNAYTNNPVCCAARSTIATGLSTRAHGVLQNGYELDPNIATFMSVLQANNWNTAAFGKVHFESHFRTPYPDYKKYGFSETKITEDIRAGDWLDWVETEYPEYYETALATIWSLEIPHFKDYGKNHKDLTVICERLRKDFNWDSAEHPKNTPFMYTLPFPKEMSQTEWITRNTIDYINNAGEEPMCVQVGYIQPHSPHCPPAEYLDKVDVSKIPAPIKPEWVDGNSPKCFPDTEGARKEIPKDWLDMRHYYYADIVHLDENIGRILDALEQKGRLDDALIIFMSDHGELLLDHGFTGKGERHYDTCIRIPLIVKAPGLSGGTSCADFVEHEDIFPTILSFCNVDEPSRPLFKDAMDSVDFVEGAPVKQKLMPKRYYAGNSLIDIANANAEKRSCAYIESYNNIESFTPINWARTVRTDRWRYTLYPMGSGEQLFDMKNDPDESNNLAGNSEYSEIKDKMKNMLLEKIILQDYPHSPNSLYMLGVH